MGIHPYLLERNIMIKETTKCPYSVSGICYRRTCIYLPDMKCLKENEFKTRLSIAKKYSKKHKKPLQRGIRG